MASENKDEMAKHSSWSEGILGDKAAPSAVAYSWIDRNVPVSGRTHMLLADLTAGVHARNPSLSVQQAVLAAAKDMVQKGVATSDLRTFVEQGGRFSRPGEPDTFAVEDRFYFGKGRKERFADDAKQIADTILKQLGGGRFIAMTGAKNLAFASNPPGLHMSIGRGAKSGIKYLRVNYDRGSDTYTMKFLNNSGGTVREQSFVHADQLRRVFTSTTGFDTSL